MSELSAKQRQILEYMKAEVREKGYPLRYGKSVMPLG